MKPTDIADVSGHTYIYLMNGTAPAGNWTGLFRPGERVRLRFVNGSSMTYFDVRIPGLKMTVVAADGQNVHPVTVDEYELLFTNRLILQPLVELDIYGKPDPKRGIGSGLSSGEAGVRLRYELRRELAPYVGVTWKRKFFGTADLAETAGEDTGGAKLALGVRLWF